MLFSTQHAHRRIEPYEIEIIDRPTSAKEIKLRFPYLAMKSLLELEVIGEQIVAEVTGGPPRRYGDLTNEDQKRILQQSGSISNPLAYWLKQKAESMYQDLESLTTDSGVFEKLLESPS